MATENEHFSVTFPDEHIILVTLTKQAKLNAINLATSLEIAKVWERLDRDENLWVGIITGTGRAFCTGADLHEWNQLNKEGVVNDMSPPGLAGLPRRNGKKPIIAAVNGITMGGGFEMIANCDLIVASSEAVFALSEVKRGIVPVAGSLPRLTRTIGLQRTMDLALTGRSVTAHTLFDWGLINRVVKPGEVIDAAVQLARDMCNNSPDALIVARRGIRLSWETAAVEEAVSLHNDQWYPLLLRGQNFHEGIRAFVEKQSPEWINSKL